jgi:hypothetical protein
MAMELSDILSIFYFNYSIISHIFKSYNMYAINIWHEYGCWYQGLNHDLFGNKQFSMPTCCHLTF